jgi:secreted PhoX family phosphatase
MAMSRRHFLLRGAATAGGAALAVGSTAAALRSSALSGFASGFGEPVADPGGLLDLPPGFDYRGISEEGAKLSNGAPVPGDFDGMAAIGGGRRGETLLVRNHELGGSAGDPVAGVRPYAGGGPGGTTALVVGPDRRVREEIVCSSGTRENCAGGATPWGTWITCEEEHADEHGYAFEVDPRDPESELSRTPIRAMGHFPHEAVAVDRRTGMVYLTEDGAGAPAGLDGESFLYRFVPDEPRGGPGTLHRGGRLEALALDEPTGGTLAQGRRSGVAWRPVDPEDAHRDALALGCARFRRLEGCDFAYGTLWFADTSGGPGKGGQIFRYRPASRTLELFYEAAGRRQTETPDNLTVTPFGDLWYCTDERKRLVGLTPAGEVYEVARNRLNGSELAGPTFSPDGRTLFLNLQSPGLTFAIWGPFDQGLEGSRRAAVRARGGARGLAAAAPPETVAPTVSEAVAAGAARHGISALEAAAYERLGVTLG